jgi:hypothetical protein
MDAGGHGPPASDLYDGCMSENDKSNSKGIVVKSSIGVLGALATIISVWWFAFRPRKKDE